MRLRFPGRVELGRAGSGRSGSLQLRTKD